MKKTIRERLLEFFESLKPVLKRYPVEMGLMVFAFVMVVIAREAEECSWVAGNLLFVPIFFTLAYVSNTLTRNAKKTRYIYYFSSIPGLILWLMRFPFLWGDNPVFWITTCALCPLAVLLCRRATDNRSFVRDVVAYIGAGFFSGVFVSVAFGLFLAIYFSVIYIFHIFENTADGALFYAAAVGYLLLQPLFFFALLDRMLDHELSASKLLGNLLNWIVTPALLIYTGILYLYALKITVTWTLPEGNIAYMVFGFTILALIVKALRMKALKQGYGWFYARFSLIALPPLALFWVGTLYRVGEYGLTEPRVWLIVCGLLMSICIGLFLTERLGRYLYFCAVAFAVIAAVTYVPSLKPREMALRSQEKRVERIVDQLGLHGALGNKTVDRIENVDTAEYKLYHKLYESAQYLYWNDDTLALKRTLGVADPGEFLDRLPAEVRYYALNGEPSEEYYDFADDAYCYLENENTQRIDIGDYKSLYVDKRYYGEFFSFENDTLVLNLPDRPEWRMAGADLLERQFRKIGCPEGGQPTSETLKTCANELLRFEEEDLFILFESMGLGRQKDSIWIINSIDLRFALTK